MVTHPAFNFVQQGLTSVNRLELVILFGANGARLYSITHCIARICSYHHRLVHHSLRLVSFCTQTPRFEEWELFADLPSETGFSTPTSCGYLCGRTVYNYSYLRRRSGELLMVKTSLSFETLLRWIFEPCHLARYQALVSHLPLTPHHSFLWNYLSFALSEISKSWNHIIRCIINVTKCPVRSITNCSQVTAETRDIVSDVWKNKIIPHRPQKSQSSSQLN